MTFLIDAVILLGFHAFMGYTGQINFGVSGFVAIGAYMFVLGQTKIGLPYPIALAAAIPVGVAVSFVLSELFLRLRGHMMAIATLVFGLVVWLMARSLIEFTGGDDGIPSVRPELFGERLGYEPVYYLTLAIVVIIFLLVERLVHSRVGRALTSVEHDELLAATVGVNTHHYLRLMFIVSGTAMVLGGALYAQNARWVSANDFSLLLSFDILVMALVGGVGHNRGMFAGIAVMMVVGELLTGLQEWRLAVSGVVLLAILFLAPQGIAGELGAFMERRARFRRLAPGHSPVATVAGSVKPGGDGE
ncbi:MAG: branched-chain amino acid ABC transporter permease [Candidatus Limnocylindrales bacterium]